MKLKLPLSLFAIFSTLFCTADQPQSPNFKNEKCGTVSHTNYLISQNPSLEQQIIQDENDLQQIINSSTVSRSAASNAVYTIPVVVHVIYRTSGENISDAQILSQIDVLNEDFGHRNADTTNIPSAFRTIASATNFQFCLAKTDPTGASTNGIERRQTTLQSFSTGDDMKFYSSGGLDAWNVNKYLNIWVCNLGGFILGYGEMPAPAHTNTYGVVIQYDSFGRVGVVSSPYNKGRTCTHEISHCFRLYHIWGDDNGSCSGSDYVNDTPNQSDATFGCLNYPHTDNCSPVSPGIMFMNYMDYSDDNCLNMFTANQASRMYYAVNSYYPTLLGSNACSIVDGIESISDFEFSVYPNPSSGIINLDMFTTKNIGTKVNVRVTDALGKNIMEYVIQNPNGYVHQLDLQHQQSGIYFITIYNENYKRTERITLAN